MSSPIFVLANCNKAGATVVFVNGIFGNEALAKLDKNNLRDKFLYYTQDKSVRFINGYNESHINGLGDLIKSVTQAYGNEGVDYDLTTILNQVHEQLETRKILLVGHSQGTFYTNAAYEYLIKNGVPSESIVVYNVATPADRVGGNGNYLTSSTDKVINSIVRDLAIVGSAKKPLPANIDIKLSAEEENSSIGGHSFSDVYLVNAPDRIIGDVDKALNNLADEDEESKNASYGCFIKPGESLKYKVTGAGLGGADKASNILATLGNSIYKTSSGALANLYDWGSKIKSVVTDLINKKGSLQAALSPVSNEDDTQNNVSFFNSEEQNLENNLPEENFTGTGGPDLALMTELDLEDLLDDISEKLDLIKQQILDLLDKEKKENLPDTDPAKEDNDKKDDKKEDDNGNNQNNTNNNAGSGGSAYFPKILISEVQIASSNDEKSEFVELYNPNGDEVDLTGWYLQKKTATGSGYSSYAPNSLFSGLKITAKGYFLIARKGYFANIANISVENSITKDNSFVLKNPNGEVSDKLGLGQSQDCETSSVENPANGQSVGRKVSSDETEQETDNNLNDFEIQNPTPKAKNTTFVQEPQPGGGDGTLGKDIKAPEVNFKLDAVQKSLTFAINFNIADVADAVSPSGLSSYIFRWQEKTDVPTNEWQEDLPVQVSGHRVSADFVREFTGEDGKTYNFQVKAKDLDGNESDWQPETPVEAKIIVPKTILINEIQVDGLKDEKEDFVELYNPNNKDVDLTGWYLQRKTADGEKYSSYATNPLFEGKIIKAKGYFLIAREGYFATLADIFVDEPITDDNSFVLKRDDGSISDKVGWGNASEFETAPSVAPSAGQSIERKIIGGDTDNNFADFRISKNPTPKESFMKAGIQVGCDRNFGNDDYLYYYNLSLSWSSPVFNLDFFQVQYKINDGAWQNWLTKTTETSGKFKAIFSAINENNVYSFRVKSQDKDGNESDWQEVNIDLSFPVVINEVGLFGTLSNKNDTWIELYNKLDTPVDLTGWQIVSNNNKTILSGTIPAKGYFILEKNDDYVLSDILANQIFTEDLSLDSINLLDENNRYIDSVFKSDWNYGNLEQKHFSLERISPWAFGFVKENWKLNDEKSMNGKDRDENLIYGTPGNKNSYYQLYTYLPIRFSQNTTLPKFLSPYFFNKDIKVFEGATLTIEQGVVLKAGGSSKITVDGTLKTTGTSEEKVVFTSFLDDEYGGDANNNGTLSAPGPGAWLGVEFTQNSLNSKLDYAVFRYGGAGLLTFGAAVKVNKTSVSIENSVFQNNLNRGLFLANSSSNVNLSQFLDTKDSDPSTSFNASGIHIQGGKDKITNCYFNGNRNGAFVQDWDDGNDTITNTEVLFENNNFEKNRNPIYLMTLNSPSFLGNKVLDNDNNAIVISDKAMKDDTILSADLPYFLDGFFYIPEGKTLTLSPGVIMNLSGMFINGTLKAVGTIENPIIFRTYYWDKEGVGPGAWYGLSFSKTSQKSELENIEIFLAGNFWAGVKEFGAGIKVDQCDISLKDSYLHDNQNHGVWLLNSNSIIDNVKFLNHTAVQFSGTKANAIYIQGGSPEVKNSYFEKQSYGIFLAKWPNPETGTEILPNPKLHTEEGDPEKNIFRDTEIPGGDIFDFVIP